MLYVLITLALMLKNLRGAVLNFELNHSIQAHSLHVHHTLLEPPSPLIVIERMQLQHINYDPESWSPQDSGDAVYNWTLLHLVDACWLTSLLNRVRPAIVTRGVVLGNDALFAHHVGAYVKKIFVALQVHLALARRFSLAVGGHSLFNY